MRERPKSKIDKGQRGAKESRWKVAKTREKEEKEPQRVEKSGKVGTGRERQEAKE